MKPSENTQLARINELQEKVLALHLFEGHKFVLFRKYYRLALTWTSNAIEGSSYNESETKILLEDGITIGGKTLRDTFATLGHAKAFDYMFTLLQQKTLSEKDILAMHGMMQGGLETEEAGTYRSESVFVTGSDFKFPSSKAAPKLMGELFEKTMPGMQNLHPVVQAARFHKEFVYIHPFGDGNGRIARLGMNTILLQHGFLPVQIHPVIRQEYIDALRLAQSDDTVFVNLILQQQIESQKKILRLFDDSEQ